MSAIPHLLKVKQSLLELRPISCVQRLLSSTMFASWAAIGQEVNAQIKLLGEYFGA